MTYKIGELFGKTERALIKAFSEVPPNEETVDLTNESISLMDVDALEALGRALTFLPKTVIEVYLSFNELGAMIPYLLANFLSNFSQTAVETVHLDYNNFAKLSLEDLGMVLQPLKAIKCVTLDGNGLDKKHPGFEDGVKQSLPHKPTSLVTASASAPSSSQSLRSPARNQGGSVFNAKGSNPADKRNSEEFRGPNNRR
ncbi:MAG: hypothetical protein NXI01_01645 [Gammaproteobacteria bacterium]|nr:hypothetical protein [Gammaproteobacteria bacterium]